MYDPDIVSPDIVEDFSLLQEGVDEFRDFNLQDTAYSLAAAAVLSNPENIYPGYSIGHEQERELWVVFSSTRATLPYINDLDL